MPETENTKNKASKAPLTKAEKTKKDTKSPAKRAPTHKDKKPFGFTLTRKTLFLVFSPLFLSLLIVLGYKYKGEVIVATVNGVPITRLTLWQNLEQQMGTQGLETLITQELILQEGSKKNIVVTQLDVDTELKSIEEIVSAQGLTLEQALASQRTTKKQLREQIILQKTVEKLVEDDISVTQDEVDEVLAQALEAGNEDSPKLREQIKTQLEQTKLSQGIQEYLATIRQNARINVLNNSLKNEL